MLRRGAYEILQRYGHNQVDTEHILLALLEQPEGVIPQILEKISVDQELIKKRLDDVLRASPKPPSMAAAPGRFLSTPRVKRHIDLATKRPTAQGRVHLHRAHLPGHPVRAQHGCGPHPVGGRHHKERVYDTVKDIRGGQRVTDPGRNPLPHAGEVFPRPDYHGQGR